MSILSFADINLSTKKGIPSVDYFIRISLSTILINGRTSLGFEAVSVERVSRLIVK